MISSRRSFLKTLFVAPAIITATNLMPVKAFAHLLEPTKPNFRLSPGVYPVEIDITYRVPPQTPQEALERILQDTLFEPNDAFTRAKITNQVEQYLAEQKAKGELYDYTVICDQTNNTPQGIDSNQLYADIYLQPFRSVEYIKLRALATRTGVDFNQLVAGSTF